MAGRSFATNGPLLELTVGGRALGEELRLARETEVLVRVSLRSNVAVDHLELVRNGAVALEIPLAWTLARPLGWGPDGAFAAVAISFSTLALASAVLFRRGRWKTRTV